MQKIKTYFYTYIHKMANIDELALQLITLDIAQYVYNKYIHDANKKLHDLSTLLKKTYSKTFVNRVVSACKYFAEDDTIEFLKTKPTFLN